MPFDTSSYLRLDAPQCVNASAAGATFATSSGDLLEVSVFGPGVFRLRIGPETRPDYGMIVGKTKSCTVTAEAGGRQRIGTDGGDLVVGGAPLAITLALDGHVVMTSITDEHARGGARLPAFGRVRHGGQWTAAFALRSGEPVYGLGEKFGPLDKRGQLLHSWVQDAMGVNTGLAYCEVPFAWSPGTGRGAWGVFVHTPGAVIHGVGHPDWSHRTYAVVVDGEAIDLFLFIAPTPADLLARYAQLTGRTRPVPLWSLGLAWQRTSLAAPGAAVAALAELRARRIPCDTVMLHAGAMCAPGQRFDFEWDATRWPDPALVCNAIREQGARVCVWESPYVAVQSPLFEHLAGRGLLLRNAHGAPYVLSGAFLPPLGPAPPPGDAPHISAVPTPDCGLVDLTNPGAYAFWRDAHAALFAAGVAAVETDGREHVPEDAHAANGDRGTRLHNVYPLLLNRCAFEATDRARNPADGAPFLFGRGGWAGVQTTPVHTSGEAQHDWEALAASIRGALSLGMSGVPLHAMACPGTYGGHADPELALRWLQAALFASHCIVRGPREAEPWQQGEPAEAVARKWLAFRYRLLPYLARVVETACATGLPVMRAMPLAFPGNTLVRRYETQFLCGDALLVAPILQAGGEVEIAMPPGYWHDLNSRQRVPGQRVLRYRASLEQFPVFAREGYALPLGRAVQHTGAIDPAEPLEQLWVFGRPTEPLTGFAQCRIAIDGDTPRIEAAAGVKVERFGEAAACPVVPMDRG